MNLHIKDTLPDLDWETRNDGEQEAQMIDNQELPIGFTMELAQHSDILNRFAGLNKQEQDALINGARLVDSREEMREYVRNMFV